jgi:hypothetical protein
MLIESTILVVIVNLDGMNLVLPYVLNVTQNVPPVQDLPLIVPHVTVRPQEIQLINVFVNLDFTKIVLLIVLPVLINVSPVYLFWLVLHALM